MLFNEKEMSLALAKLFELFSPSDYEAFDEEEIGYAGGLCLPEVCMALKDAVQTVYQYSVIGGYEKSFDYRGIELFNQRGCLILSDVEQMVFDEAKTTYATELWLLEDMSFAIVHCVKMKIGSEDTGYVTEYHCRYPQVFAAPGKSEDEKGTRPCRSWKAIRETAFGTESGCYEC